MLTRRVHSALLLVALALTACQGPPPPAPAEIRVAPPPWDAPRDASSYIEQAGFEVLPLDFRGPAPYTLKLVVRVDGKHVAVPANIGIDRLRAEQAPVHTHADDGVVYVETRTTAERPTLPQFFTLWGVRYDANCLGAACGSLKVTVNGEPAPWDTSLSRNTTIEVAASTR